MRYALTTCVAWIVLACLAAHGGEPEPAASPPRYVRIGHYQCICRQGDFEANLATVLKGLELAAEARLDILSFPESMLTGYFAHEADARQNSFAIDSPQIRQVLQRTAQFETLFLVGFNELRDGQLYDTVAVIERGQILGHYHKAMPVFSLRDARSRVPGVREERPEVRHRDLRRRRLHRTGSYPGTQGRSADLRPPLQLRGRSG